MNEYECPAAPHYAQASIAAALGGHGDHQVGRARAWSWLWGDAQGVVGVAHVYRIQSIEGGTERFSKYVLMLANAAPLSLLPHWHCRISESQEKKSL